MRIAVAGSGSLAAGLLTALLESRHAVVAVLQNGRQRKRERRGFWGTVCATPLLSHETMIRLAARNRIPVFWIDRMDDAELAPLRAMEPDLVLVGGFSIILKGSLLDLPKVGCVNVHSSLLPKHRGPNPFAAVILANEAETGVTFHTMDEAIDTGDILEQYAFRLGPEDTALSVYEKCVELAAWRVPEVMDRIEREGLRGRPQDHAAATYDKKLAPSERLIDWRQGAREIERKVRACTPFDPARFIWRGRTVNVFSALCETGNGEGPPGMVVSVQPLVTVATGDRNVVIADARTAGAWGLRWPRPWDRPKVGEQVG